MPIEDLLTSNLALGFVCFLVNLFAWELLQKHFFYFFNKKKRSRKNEQRKNRYIYACTIVIAQLQKRKQKMLQKS